MEANSHLDLSFYSNLKAAKKTLPPKEFLPVFLKPLKMCFEIDVEKLTLVALRESLARISSLLSKPSVVARLPDNGHQLRQTKIKLQKEIKFREGLNTTKERMEKLSIRSSSETDLKHAHAVRLCSLERKPERERFRPNLSRRSIPSGQTESMKELSSGVQLIDLNTSLTLQKEQEERVKEEQLRAKHFRMLAAFKIDDDEDGDASSLSDDDEGSEVGNEEDLGIFNEIEDGEELEKVVKEYVLTGNIENNDEVEEHPGPSGVQMVKITRKRPASEENSDDSLEEGTSHDAVVPELDMPGPSGLQRVPTARPYATRYVNTMKKPYERDDYDDEDDDD